MKTSIVSGLLFISIVGVVGYFLYQETQKPLSVTTQQTVNQEETMPKQNSNAQTQGKQKQLSPPEMMIDQNQVYTAEVTTSAGSFTIELNQGETPKTVNNFVYLADKGFYDNTIFHRVIKGFMIQGGDPTGTGSGGPGYRFEDEEFSGSYVKGTVAMANAGPNTNGSQFFIMHGDVDLPPSYTIFGKVISGLDIIDAIATQSVTQSEMGENSKPTNPVKITSIVVRPPITQK